MTKTTTAGKNLPSQGCEISGHSISVRSQRVLIQWPSLEQLDKVSMQLRRINQIGISSEANGDYFTSGDLAYQLHEILRATGELLNRSMRREQT